MREVRRATEEQRPPKLLPTSPTLVLSTRTFGRSKRASELRAPGAGEGEGATFASRMPLHVRSRLAVLSTPGRDSVVGINHRDGPRVAVRMHHDDRSLGALADRLLRAVDDDHIGDGGSGRHHQHATSTDHAPSCPSPHTPPDPPSSPAPNPSARRSTTRRGQKHADKAEDRH